MKLLKNIILSACISFGLIWTNVSHAQTADAIKVQSGQKVAFLGDSITQFGWERPGGYVRLVVAGLDSVGVKVVPVPAGISGNTSRDMLARVDRDVISKKPDWMTLSCGVNDVWHGLNGVDLPTYKTNMAAIVDKAQAAGIKVMILTATVIQEGDNPFNQKLVAYNDYLRELAKEKNLPLADLNTNFWTYLKAPHTGGLTVDGVHMNPKGNMLMARGILDAFGLTSDQVDKYEETWRNSPDAASVLGTVGFSSSAPISLSGLDRLQAIARDRKISINDLQSSLVLEALRKVLKAHEQDATLSPVQVQGELKDAFSEEIAALVKPDK